MKLSKSLLQAMAIGLAVGAAAPSCTLLENTNDVKPQEEKASEGKCTTDDGQTQHYDCPACGMG